MTTPSTVSSTRRWGIVVGAALVVLGLDQLTKAWAVDRLKGHDSAGITTRAAHGASANAPIRAASALKSSRPAARVPSSVVANPAQANPTANSSSPRPTRLRVSSDLAGWLTSSRNAATGGIPEALLAGMNALTRVTTSPIP